MLILILCHISIDPHFSEIKIGNFFFPEIKKHSFPKFGKTLFFSSFPQKGFLEFKRN